MGVMDWVRERLPDTISLRDIPVPLLGLAVAAAPLINQTGLLTITADPPAKTHHTRPSSSVAVKPPSPPPEKSILTRAQDFVADRVAGKPLPVNIASLSSPIMPLLDTIGVGAPLRHGTFDLLAGSVETILEGADWVRGSRRDQGWAGPTAQWLEEKRRDVARVTGDGDYAIYNGAGWSSQGKEGGLTSIFVRQVDGQSEMLRPGQAEYWKHMGPYAIPMVASMFYGGGEVKGVAAAFKTVSGLEMAGTAAVLGGEINQVITLKPEAYRTLSRLTHDPSLLNDPRAMTEIMNDIFGEYARKEGSMAGPIYIPSLQNGDDPYKMLQNLASGNVPAYKRDLPTDAFDKPAAPMGVRDLVQNIESNNSYMYGFHGLAAKMADGNALTNAEYSTLRLSLNILRPENQLSLNPAALTETDKAQTRDLVNQYYATNAHQNLVGDQAVAKQKSESETMMDILNTMEKQESTPPVDIKAITTAEQARIETERQETMARIQADTMANLYRGPKF